MKPIPVERLNQIADEIAAQFATKTYAEWLHIEQPYGDEVTVANGETVGIEITLIQTLPEWVSLSLEVYDGFHAVYRFITADRDASR